MSEVTDKSKVLNSITIGFFALTLAGLSFIAGAFSEQDKHPNITPEWPRGMISADSCLHIVNLCVDDLKECENK